jgi:putative acetyltransferase
MSQSQNAQLEIAIRNFDPTDAPALWNIFYSAIHQLAAEDYSPQQLAAWAPQQIDLEKWATRMRGISPFIAQVNSKPVGYADVQPNGYIDHFFVSPTVARRGVGTSLMRHIHQQANALQLTRLFSDVSITARPFFEHFDFAVEKTQSVSINGIALTNYRMSTSLHRFLSNFPGVVPCNAENTR